MKNFILGFLVALILSLGFLSTTAKANTVNKYMEMGDKYLQQADNSLFTLGAVTAQAFSTQAIACYIAAYVEDEMVNR